MSRMKKNKVVILILIIIIFLAIFLIIFSKNNYKNLKTGNNITNKSKEEIEQYILNISSYEAKVSVTIESNKNTNSYVLIQKYVAPNKSSQTVLEPANIEGMQLYYDGSSLTITNTRLNLSKVYENYNYLSNNYLCLETFIEEYKTGSEQDKRLLRRRRADCTRS